MKWGDNWKQGNEREQGVKPDGKVLSLSLETQSADDGKKDTGRPPPMGPTSHPRPLPDPPGPRDELCREPSDHTLPALVTA